jgi:hypothetical protein
MLSLALRTKSEAELLQAVQAPCGHSLPGRWYPRPCRTMGIDSRFENVEGLP